MTEQETMFWFWAAIAFVVVILGFIFAVKPEVGLRELVRRIGLWLKPMCRRCYELHIKESRDVIQGDYWRCAAGIHGYDYGTPEQQQKRMEIAKWMWHGNGALETLGKE